jgi:peptide deformylase
MGQLSIVTASLETMNLPSICLRQKAAEVPADTSPTVIKKLIEEMLACLYTAGGVGLAAPQVGVSWRLFLAMERSPAAVPMVMINPKFLDMSDELVEGREGCLSLPDYVSFKVPRSRVVTVEALNQFLDPVRLQVEDFVARVMQHEYDHLDGILYPDRLKDPGDLEEIVETQARVKQTVDELFTLNRNDTDMVPL